GGGGGGGGPGAVPDAPPALVFEAAPGAGVKPPPASRSEAPPAAHTAPASPDPAAELSTLSAAGWCVAVVAVVVLFARVPRATWPEQVGLLAGMFGVAVAGGLAVGVAAYGVARAVWLAGGIARWRARPVPA
ncbi:MAG: hypothetical protein JWO38_5157, partial [Gemmataceae bacterium]|nr:hypothetical protein [Gemmataceae bacterium]